MKFQLRYLQLGNFDWLWQKYILEQLSCQEIALDIGCSRDAVRVALRRHKISIRTSKETNNSLLKRKSKKSKYTLLNDEAWLRQKHLVEKTSLGVLTKLSGAQQSNSVLQAFKKFNIELIPHEECEIHLPNAKPKPFDNDLIINIDVLNGCLLGDAFLSVFNEESDNSYPSFEKRNKFLDHVNLINDLLFNGAKSPKEEWHRVNGKKVRAFKISSYCDPRLKIIFKTWYPKWNDYKKVIPEDVEINETVLLHWFLDDGSTSYRNRNYKNGWLQRKKQVRLVFCTECFTKENQQLFCDKINKKFPLDVRLKKTNSGTGWRIGVPQSKVGLFYEIIGPPPVPSLAYKWK